MGLNIGSASIIMLFAVLSLTVLAALSLLSANSQYALARRSADAVSDYYAADYEAAGIYERIASGDHTGVNVSEEAGVTYYRYSVEMASGNSLDVVLTAEGEGRPAVVSWQIADSGDWEADDVPLNVWQGDE
jgi:hypothetical protein